MTIVLSMIIRASRLEGTWRLRIQTIVVLNLLDHVDFHSKLEFQEFRVGHLCIGTIPHKLEVCMNTRCQ